MEKIDLTQPILGLDDKVLKNEDKSELTFVSVIGLACTNALENDSAEQKYNDFVLGVKITANPKSVELSVEEKARIKKKVGELFPPITVGRVWDLLEGK